MVRLSPRSEEHTSELQSRFGISYAVFCLKKKNKQYWIEPLQRALWLSHGRCASYTAATTIYTLPLRGDLPIWQSHHAADPCFFFNDTAPAEIYPFPLQDVLPI